MSIHPTAVIAPDARIAEGVEIGPYSIVGPSVTIGRNTVIGPHVVIESHTDLGEGNRIFQFASIGGVPQDLKYRGEETRVVIGNHNIIKEFVTINRSTVSDIGVTIMGDQNLIMAYCHIAHNCKLGNHVIMANATNLAGHIHVEDWAIIGGMTGVHQFIRIGAHAFVGGASAVGQDVPPFITVSGNRARPYGLNVVGLRRRGFSEPALRALRESYRLVYRSSLRLVEAIARIRAEVEDLPEVRQFVSFLENSQRGICR